VELDGKVLVIKRIHCRLEVKADPEHRPVVERVGGFFADFCPLYRTLKPAIAITTEVSFVG
jgi:hypothetical protein